MDTAKEVGGDFYDFYLVGESKLAFVIADVSGKGIPAAMFMMRVKTLLKSLVEGGTDLAEAFYNANNKLCEGNDAEMFVTVWMGILDVTSGRLAFVNAGHNPSAICRKGGQFEYLKTKANLVLGMMEGIPYRMNEIALEEGDCLYLYTDRVTESQNTKEVQFGEERLLDCLNACFHASVESSVREVCERVKEKVDGFAGDAEQADDITMLAVRFL